ncbi:MAG TPA: PadR family transcriptional regulator [Pseudonocardiaceae bacterium]|jgi:DNA-binding PadR family transcriptional regulator
MDTTSTRRSTLALAVLSMLGEAEQHGQPALHPYKMQRLIKDRGKDEVINVGQRASLYRTIDRLRRIGLIRVVESKRDDKRPERTLYALTDEGRKTWREWILDALATPTRNYSEFPAAIAFMPLLDPADVLEQLEKRRDNLAAELDRIKGSVEDSEGWGRLFALEMEYLRVTTAAELGWIETIVSDLRSGSITWTTEWLDMVTDPEKATTESSIPVPGTGE